MLLLWIDSAYCGETHMFHIGTLTFKVSCHGDGYFLHPFSILILIILMHLLAISSFSYQYILGCTTYKVPSNEFAIQRDNARETISSSIPIEKSLNNNEQGQ